MSDAVLIALLTFLGTVVTSATGVIVILARVRSGMDLTQETSNKVDQNTVITTQAKDAATKASAHAEGCDAERKKMLASLADHDARIKTMEGQVISLMASVENVTKNVDSTRHEMRGHLQGLGNKLDLALLTRPAPIVVPTVSPAPPTGG